MKNLDIKVVHISTEGKRENLVTLYDDESEEIILTCTPEEFRAWRWMDNTIQNHARLKAEGVFGVGV